MQSQAQRKSHRISALPRHTPLASCLALALALSAGASSSIAGDRSLDRRAPSTMQASRITQTEFEPGEVFANIQKWRADHPRPQQPASTLGATVHVVENCDDSGYDSLRAHVDHAVSGDTIDMSSLECDVIALDTFLSIDQGDLTLQGSIVSGVPVPWIQPTGTSLNIAGLLVHTGVGTLTVDSLTLMSGTKYNRGGCVNSNGSVVMDRSVAKYCSAVATDNDVAAGGAIFAAGTVTLLDSVVRDNAAYSETGTSEGGGVFADGLVSMYSAILDNVASSTGSTSFFGGAYSAGNAIVSHSTIAGNSADASGGLHLYAGGPGGPDDAIVVESSTISGNSSESGAALTLISNGGMITVTNTTVTDNVATDAGVAGLTTFSLNEASAVSNTIVSGNVGDGLGYDFSAGGTIVSGDHNLIGYAVGGNAPGGILEYDTPLGPLMDNGGPTPTHAIGTGSWAFNQGQTSATHDQRLMPRPVGTGDDIGAFESDALFIGRFEEPTLLGAN